MAVFGGVTGSGATLSGDLVAGVRVTPISGLVSCDGEAWRGQFCRGGATGLRVSAGGAGGGGGGAGGRERDVGARLGVGCALVGSGATGVGASGLPAGPCPVSTTAPTTATAATATSSTAPARLVRNRGRAATTIERQARPVGMTAGRRAASLSW